jgi:hypothetical protein
MNTRVRKGPGLGVWFFLAILLVSWGGLAGAADDVRIKILAVNPSETQSLKTVVTQGLPPEIDPTKDILDKAGLEVQYDTKKKTYYLTKEVELQPKETLTFELRVRDVWTIDPETIDNVKKNLEEQINGLKETKYAETGRLLYEKAQENLDRIVEEQNQQLGINQHIELYRAHVKQLEEIQNNAFSLEAMRRLEDEKKKGVQEARFVIEAENPAAEPKEVTISSFLPKDIKAEDVIDRQGFNILYDESRKVYFLEKREMFDAKQNKKYTIVLKDIWRIPEQDINYYKEQTTKLYKFFEDTPYLKYAKEQMDAIMRMLGEIVQLQGEVADSTSLEERMKAYVLNQQKMNVVKGKLHDLQQLLPELGLRKENAKDLLTRIKYWVRQLVEIKDAVLISIGLEPDTPMTWWIIFGIVLFLGIVSTVFYVVWLKKLQESRFQERKKTSLPQAAAPKSQDEKNEKADQTVAKE